MQIKGRRNKLLVVPGCCEESKKALRPYLYLDYGPIDTGKPQNPDDAETKWVIPHHDYLYVLSFVGRHVDENYINQPYEETHQQIKFCPYCGEKLPEVRRKKKPPRGVYTDEDGGCHCGTCERRNMDCSCLPEVALFEVVRKKK